MDRFIDSDVGIHILWTANLKSNMDRFIVGHKLNCHQRQKHLKSNMDRFIGCNLTILFICFLYLKSNMDRFIDNSKCSPLYLIFI